MSRWVKVGAPVALAALVLSVLAVGFASPGGHATECFGSAPATMDLTGTAASTVTHEVSFCSDATLSLAAFLQWDNAKKDLALTVTSPDGTATVVDSHGQFYEGFYAAEPLAEGTWTFAVTNNGKGRADYTLTVHFF